MTYFVGMCDTYLVDNAAILDTSGEEVIQHTSRVDTMDIYILKG